MPLRSSPMNAATIRPADATDLQKIAVLWHESWHDAHARLLPPDLLAYRTLANFLQRAEPLLSETRIAATGQANAIAGFVTPLGDEIDQLYVARAQRGAGVAGALLAEGERVLRGRGVVQALIQCAAGNDRAYAFYRKHGYADTGIFDLPLWTPPGADEARFACHLFVKRLG